MFRTIIRIDAAACNGCGACASACHEGAIEMAGGKARLTRENFCDGLGDCLPACPAGAISFEKREAPAYDQTAAEAARRTRQAAPFQGRSGGPSLRRQTAGETVPTASQLSQWPLQLQLAPVKAPYFQGADLLIAADCTAYACGDFNSRFMRDRVTMVGCPKMDQADYGSKLGQILRENSIQSVTLARMDVPCCGGLERALEQALSTSGKLLPCHVAVLSTDGRVL